MSGVPPAWRSNARTRDLVSTAAAKSVGHRVILLLLPPLAACGTTAAEVQIHTRRLLLPFQLDSPDLERQACQVSRQLPLRVETGTAVWCAGVPALPVQLAPCRRLGRLPPLLLVHITYPAPPVHLCSGELSTPRRAHRCPTSPAYRRRQPSCSAGRCWRSRGSAGWRRLGRSAAAVIQGHICQHRWQAVQLDS